MKKSRFIDQRHVLIAMLITISTCLLPSFAWTTARSEIIKVPQMLANYGELYEGKIPEYLYFYGEERNLQKQTSKPSLEVFKLKSDFSSGEWVRYFEPYSERPVLGIAAKSVSYERLDQNIFVNGVKIFTITNSEPWAQDKGQVPIDPLDPCTQNYVYEIKTPDHRLFYYLKSASLVEASAFASHNVLVEIQSGKNIWQREVYGPLQYVSSDIWRSIRHNWVGSTDDVIQHEKNKADINYSQLVAKNICEKGFVLSILEGDLQFEGYDGKKAVFSVLVRDAKKEYTHEKYFVEADTNGQVNLRTERINCFEHYWIQKGHIYSLTMDGQVIRDLTAKKRYYISGSSKNLGVLVKEKNSGLKGKIPLYRYRGVTYLRLLDLKPLGYTMKWDSSHNIESWKYTGKKTAKAPNLTSNIVQDSQRTTFVNGVCYQTIHVGGETFVKYNEIAHRIEEKICQSKK